MSSLLCSSTCPFFKAKLKSLLPQNLIWLHLLLQAVIHQTLIKCLQSFRPVPGAGGTRCIGKSPCAQEPPGALGAGTGAWTGFPWNLPREGVLQRRHFLRQLLNSEVLGRRQQVLATSEFSHKGLTKHLLDKGISAMYFRKELGFNRKRYLTWAVCVLDHHPMWQRRGLH